MTVDWFLALVIFAFVTSATPGPNTMMLMASGVNFGFRRTVPHMTGIVFGFSGMILSVGLGVAGVFQAEPRADLVLKALSVVYMLWLAWKIATAAPPRPEEASGQPFSFVQAAAFQWVNPKAWAIATTGTIAFAPGQQMVEMIWVAAVFALVGVPAVVIWAGLGHKMRNFLSDLRRLRIFNVTMAVLLVLSIWPVLA
ncbi:MAG: LysE family translocator [Pseudorhodobacter sp.]